MPERDGHMPSPAPWLTYSDDEVRSFHPVFLSAAARALDLEGGASQFEWEHHLRTLGSNLVPDFVLRDRIDHRWRLAVEIKRNRTSVHSTRNQVQAKGYAEHSADLYRLGCPKYFAIGNLEETLLFALNREAPPNQCRLKDGAFTVGLLHSLTREHFIEELVHQLRGMIRRVLSPTAPQFDEVWPKVSSDLFQTAAAIAGSISLAEPTTAGWPQVRDFFCHPPALDAARVFLLRCLLAEYLRGVLHRFGHTNAAQLLPLRVSTPARVGAELSRAFGRLRNVDFRQVFDDQLLGQVLSLGSTSAAAPVRRYIENIIQPPTEIGALARSRLDGAELIDELVVAAHEGEALDDRGKVVTDPEVAALLACLVIDGSRNGSRQRICDPCCGDGALLEAAYDRLALRGERHNTILTQLHGIEADPLLARLAIVRLLLKQPTALDTNSAVDVQYGDMFARPRIGASEADVVLMNPPFKRYEAQSGPAVPTALKAHYGKAIRSLDRAPSIATTGQQNLYTYYVEFVVKAAKHGCRLAIIVDNKWYHNTYARPLKEFLLRHCTIEAILEYPYAGIFQEWTIATSILVCRKARPAEEHQTRFIRCGVDLSRADTTTIAGAFRGEDPWPTGWTCRPRLQRELRATEGWKNYFDPTLTFDFREGLPLLPDLFAFPRRGSLAKEEGGMSALAFPFSQGKFGYQRGAVVGGRRFQTKRGAPLTRDTNRHLQELAAQIPRRFHGYAANNSDELTAYELDRSQVTKQPTVEPPILRGLPMFKSAKKTRWTTEHDLALAELHAEPTMRAFANAFRRATGLTASLMPDKDLWIGLREPVAGELIIPRKMRVGHRVHVNPMAWGTGRQVRISSNFVTFCDCKAVDPNVGLDRAVATRIIAAFLVSSFGQLQFEMKGYNREGCLSVELDHLSQISVVDPRAVPANLRARILEAFGTLVPADRLTAHQPEKRVLDEAFAEVLCARHPDWDCDSQALLSEVQALLDEYILARFP